MRFSRAYIPLGGYWCSPFCRWQGEFAHLHPIPFAAEVAARALSERQVPPDTLDGIVLGLTVPQRHAFYAAPWLAALLGAPALTGPTIAQACATGLRVLATAALEVEAGRSFALALACDRTSNGPHLYYPDPRGPGGKGESEDWVWDSFQHDPQAKNSMLETAERLAREAGISRESQEALTLLRHRQYDEARSDGFHRGFLVAPLAVKDGRKLLATVVGDSGVPATTPEGLARLAPAQGGAGATVTHGTMTRPADGNAGCLVGSRERASAIAGGRPEARILAYAEARTAPGTMPRATAPAARAALAEAGVSAGKLAAVALHNPFAASDVWFCREMGLDPEAVNRTGSPLVWGHPQAPTGLRLAIECLEGLARGGGGLGLVAGCAAGDSAAALVLEVSS